MRLLIIIFFLALSAPGFSQTCTALGQNPSTAFPVCGTSTFSQSSVPQCGGRRLPSPHCTTNPLTDVNPYWYKFTCFQSGTLGFLITPNNLSDDYDWEIYDVTGRNPDDIYTDGSLVISSNWSGESGLTGASSAGTQQFVCDGPGKPLFSSMPNIVIGHNYLMLISHFTQSQSGYQLSFGGGTGVITDPNDPHFRRVEHNCEGDIIRLGLNKHIRCNSIAADGSDFYITPALATTVSSVGIGCSSAFDTDSIEIHLSAALSPGTYSLHIKNGSDGNTLLDYCDHPIPTTDSLTITVLPRVPTPMDSLVPPSCSPSELKLIFQRGLRCSTIAPNGSDFTITGSYPVSIIGATGNCSGGSTVSKEITLILSHPLQTAGTFTVTLQQGTDGNTTIDECGQQTPAGATLSFSVKDTVNADFNYSIRYTCTMDTISYLHPGANGVNSWQWTLDEGQQSTSQNPTALYSIFNSTKNINLVVSNGFCSDTSSQTIRLINYLKAAFSVLPDQCPNEVVKITNLSEGIIKNYNWNFGDGNTSASPTPQPYYDAPYTATSYIIKLTLTDSFNCQNTAQQKITVYNSCLIAFPNAFTPNNDGKNDHFHVLNAVKALDFELIVFNRWGQVVFKTNNWKDGWDGTFNGVDQGTGTFVWFARFRNRDTNELIQQKGTVVLIR